MSKKYSVAEGSSLCWAEVAPFLSDFVRLFRGNTEQPVMVQSEEDVMKQI